MSDLATDFKAQMTEARRTQILMGAAQVFVDKGYHKSTTKEIAKAAGVSEGTIYNYFENKRELLVALVDLIGMKSLKNIIEGDPPDDPQEMITAVMRDRYQLAKERGAMMAPVLAEIFTDPELREVLYQRVVIPVSSHLEKYIQAQVEAGRFRQIDPLIATRAIMGALVVNFSLQLSGLDSRYADISEDELIEQLSSLFVNGLMAD